jgi:hypothetical protein
MARLRWGASMRIPRRKDRRKRRNFGNLRNFRNLRNLKDWNQVKI